MADINVQGCPIQHSFDPFDERFRADPISVLRDPAIASTPVFYAPSIDHYVVTRYAEMKAIFRDPETFSASNTTDPLVPLVEEARTILSDGGKPPHPSMGQSDGTTHTRLRNPAAQEFGPRRVEAMKPLIQEQIDKLLDEVDDAVTFDAVASFSRPLPMLTIFLLCGVPESEWPQLGEWCMDRLALAMGRPDPAEQVEAAQGLIAYRHFLLDFVKDKATKPLSDDLTSDLIALHQREPETLELVEIASILFSLTFAGHETTTGLIGNSLVQLLGDRNQWEELVADPSLVPKAVNEILRYDPSVPMWRRRATKDTVVGGVSIPAGSKIMMWLTAGGRDEAQWTEPDVFDIHRSGTNKALSLGLGVHYCIGASLGKLQTTLALQSLMARMPDLRLVADRPATAHNTLMRGPEALWVERGSAVR